MKAFQYSSRLSARVVSFYLHYVFNFSNDSCIIGELIGSYWIDRRFESIVNDYLKNHAVRQYLPEEFSAEHITGSDDFQVTKQKFSKESSLEYFRIDLPGLSEELSYPEPSDDGLTIKKGKIQVP